jgi:hypothetical protein
VEVFGDTERVVHGQRFYEPAVGGSVVRSLLRLGTLEAEEKMAEIFSDLGVDSQVVRTFLANREVTRLPEHMGGGLQARPIIPGLTDDNLSRYEESDGGYDVGVSYGADPIIDESSKKYKLNSLFRDATLVDKLQISARRMQSAKRLALSDPGAAAAGLTEYIQAHGFPNARVLAGDYAKTVNNAIDFIRALGNSIVYADSGAPSVVSHSHLEMSFDQFHLKDVLWTVRGPLKYATEVNIVYQLAIHYGPEHVLFMLGAETIRLGIDIRNEKTGDYYTGALHGYSSMSGILPSGSGFPSELTADQQARLMLAGRNVSPVYVGKAVVGSAVHVSDKHVILNEHTLAMAAQADSVASVCGSSIVESMSVGGDICVVRRDSEHAQWHFREPDVGERVVLCYSVGAEVEYSEVLQVLGSADQLILSESNVLRKGASGAAVIALRDSALLGIFSTKRASRVICAPFTSASFAIVSDCQSVISVSQYAGTPGVEAGDRTYAKMVKRGFLGFLEGIERATAPLYSSTKGVRRMAGLVANIAGEWHTTINPDAAQLSMADSRLLSFGASPLGTYAVNSPPPVLQAVPNVRFVEPGERVFVFTKVDGDVLMSSVRVVTHILVDRKAFIVEDFGDSDEVMIGGLIVAERDAAVVGMFARRDCDTFGSYSTHCLSLVRPVVNLTSAPVDMRVVHAEFSSWVLPFETTVMEHITYGRQVWSVAVGSKLYQAGSSLAKALAAGADVWPDRARVLLDAFSWPVADTTGLDKYGVSGVAAALLAMVYLRSPGFAMDKLDAILANVRLESTPISTDFPFPRSVSAPDFVTVVPQTERSQESTRIQDLEKQMSRLAAMVSEQEKRTSFISDNG